ncbi:flagellar assembly protein FliH [Clostridium sp. P21]|uniref:Flagellar assembly protein FliH n=1 Tax=Clostridium muellerianum TaxID=2716538 RepID=A0A7Y0HL15_9CLOT|nr:flagellar assembly protein FliH [Clostridium muellerianum]NMM61454.1 flagellar assembly protein FliH [Clostridium muellerianum]
MQSSYRIIKSTSVASDGLKKIVTEFETQESVEQKNLAETNAKTFIDSYESLAKTMVENARVQSDKLISKAFEEAERLQKEACEKGYNKGYNEGLQKGSEDGFNKAYEEGYKENIEKAEKEGQIIKDNADNILRTCKVEKERYLKEKEEEIRELIVNCVESILKREVKDKDGLNDVIFEALSRVKNTKTFIIKSNETYCEELKNKVELWKEQLPFRGDIFIIPDKDVEIGKAIIERENGKIIVSIDGAIEKVKEIVLKDQ